MGSARAALVFAHLPSRTLGSSRAPGSLWAAAVLGHNVNAENPACSAPLWKLKVREIRLADDVLGPGLIGEGRGGRVKPTFEPKTYFPQDYQLSSVPFTLLSL